MIWDLVIWIFDTKESIIWILCVVYDVIMMMIMIEGGGTRKINNNNKKESIYFRYINKLCTYFIISNMHSEEEEAPCSKIAMRTSLNTLS